MEVQSSSHIIFSDNNVYSITALQVHNRVQGITILRKRSMWNKKVQTQWRKGEGRRQLEILNREKRRKKTEEKMEM
jgi:hypothetical protein